MNPLHLIYTTSRDQEVHRLHPTHGLRMIITMARCWQGNEAAHAYRRPGGEKVITIFFNLNVI